MTADLDGRVALVTGAGRGLGRAEALELAASGARIVVNELEVTLDGSRAADTSAAQEVAGEIRDRGGDATVHHGDVSDWDDAHAMVRTAIDAYGSLDILVNNAGILRDRMIFSMSEEEFDAVVRVHLKGHFCTTRAATAYWRERSKEAGEPVDARLINTSSEAFLLGSPGQPNYAAAKGGIIGLTLAVAASCGRYGVRANAICPRARTRMTEGVFGAADASGLADPLAPDHVAPLVAALAAPATARISGQVFVAYGGTVTLMAAPTVDRRFTDDGGHWDAGALAATLDRHFEDRDPRVTFVATSLLEREPAPAGAGQERDR